MAMGAVYISILCEGVKVGAPDFVESVSDVGHQPVIVNAL